MSGLLISVKKNMIYKMKNTALIILLYIIPFFSFSQQSIEKDDLNNTIFTTWLENPTSTMTVQWLANGESYPAYVNEKFNEYPSFTTKNIPLVNDKDGFFNAPKEVGLYFPFLHRQIDVPETDLQSKVAFAWTQKELLVYIYCYDDEFIEEKKDDKLFRADSHGIVIMDNENPKDQIEVIFTSGKDPAHGKIRKNILDRRGDSKSVDIRFEIERKDISDREYELHCRMNLSALGLESPQNKEIRLQYYQYDKDSQGDNTYFSLYPKKATQSPPMSSRVFKLTNERTSYPPIIYDMVQSGAQLSMQLEKLPSDKSRYSIVLQNGEKLIPDFKEIQGRDISVLTFNHPSENSFTQFALANQNAVIGTIDLNEPHYKKIKYNNKVNLKNEKGRSVTNASVSTSPFHASGAIQTCRLHFGKLKPNQYYYFNSPVDGKQYSFKTAPENLEKPFVFAEGGDVGSDEQVVAKCHQMAGSWDPLFAFLGGDLAYANGAEITKWVKYLKLWSQNMRGPKGNLIPMLVTIGNHEVEGGNGMKPENAPFFYSLFGGNPAKFTDGAYANYDFGNYLRLISLDSDHTKSIPSQNSWLEQSLKEGEAFDFVFPAYHVPAYPSYRPYTGSGSTEIRKNWTPLFDKYKVPIVFEHHDHAYKRTHPLVNQEIVKEGVVYLGDGSWGRAPRKLNSTVRPYLAVAKSSLNIIKVTVDMNKVLFEAYNEKEEIIDSFEIEAKK